MERDRPLSLLLLTTVISGLVMLSALGDLRVHAQPAAQIERGASKAVPLEAPALSTNAYRLGQVEKQVAEMEKQQWRLMWLLVANLAAVVASLLTYILTHGRNRRGRPARESPPG